MILDEKPMEAGRKGADLLKKKCAHSAAQTANKRKRA